MVIRDVLMYAHDAWFRSAHYLRTPEPVPTDVWHVREGGRGRGVLAVVQPLQRDKQHREPSLRVQRLARRRDSDFPAAVFSLVPS